MEIKNISSFKEVERALSFEIMRQKDLRDKGLSIERETRHWDETRRITITLRSKEEEHDYRYFPEPDLVPITITKDRIEKAHHGMPELPDARIRRFITSYGLPKNDAVVLVSDKVLADFFEHCVTYYHNPKKVSNWMKSDLLRYLNESNTELAQSKITPEQFVQMIRLIDTGVISGKIAKQVLKEMVATGHDPQKIVDGKGLTKIAYRETLERIATKVFSENPDAVRDALIDEKAVHFLVGQLMKATEGKADPIMTNQVIQEKLKALKGKSSS